jgi:hypothetical protein
MISPSDASSLDEERPSDVSSLDEERAALLKDDQLVQTEKTWCRRTIDDLPKILRDIVYSIPFYWLMVFSDFAAWKWYTGFGVVLTLMIAWRLYRAYSDQSNDPHKQGEPEVPYTVGVCKSNGKTMFLVATIHIAPRAPVDVETVIRGTNPDIAMIELDDERLDKMRGPTPEELAATERPKPKSEDLQCITVSQDGTDDFKIYAQFALWNAEKGGETVSGRLMYDGNNKYGMEIPTSRVAQVPCLSLVERGAENGEFAPFALKAHLAHRAGHSAVLFMNKDDNLPMSRIGGASTVQNDLKVAWKTKSCGFPPIPGYLITRSDSDRLTNALKDGRIDAELKVRNDGYPRRTLRKRLCQGCALIFSGIGILYGIIQCAGVEVGGEFIAAEEVAHDVNIPCVCIDSNLNDFWATLGAALIPVPNNVIDSVLAWLALPRIMFQVFFPPRHNVDVAGTMVLHAKSFLIRTWIAFIIAGYLASKVTSLWMRLLSNGTERAGEATGVVKKEDRELAQDLSLLLLEMYMLPRIYQAVAASRDEVMYRTIVKKSRLHDSKRMVVVVGAGHSNGILHYARMHGL